MQPSPSNELAALRATLARHLPPGFEEVAAGDASFSYVVPRTSYPAGYHCDPRQPLPFITVERKKGGITIHHMGLYADESLRDWFLAEYPKHSSSKPDLGKGCVRFKPNRELPLELIGQLAGRMSPSQWIERYESLIKR